VKWTSYQWAVMGSLDLIIAGVWGGWMAVGWCAVAIFAAVQSIRRGREGA
jgi:hypothetical protein